MNSLTTHIKLAAIFFFGMAFLLTNCACNQKKSSSDTTSFEEKPSTTSSEEKPSTIIPAESSLKDSLGSRPTRSTPPPTPKTGSEDDKTVYPTPAPKVCQPNFKMLGKPKGNHYLFYLTGFNAGEFKCWNLVEDHGVSICNGQPCVIYYVDDPNATMSAPPPNYVDPKILKEHGWGQFSHDENWWEMKGAKIWGRQGKEFLYFNTNNNAGG